MKETISNIIIIVALVTAVFTVIFIFAYWLGGKWHGHCERLELEYERLYAKIQKYIGRASVCHKNYCIILLAIKRLEQLKYSNPEKTNKLCENFKEKFIEIHREILEEANDEFSPASVFRK